MKVNIEDHVFLESDGMQFVLKKYSGKTSIDKNGKENEVYTTLGYYSQVRHAVLSLVKMKLMNSTASDLKELLESVQGIEEWIKEKVGV